MTNQIQLDKHGNLKHFISIDGLPAEILISILDQANKFLSLNEPNRQSKKVPLLRGKTIVNLFFEPSTRTRMSFELAQKRLSADILNLDIATSSTSKGESLIDTLNNIIAMQVDMLVVRHHNSGAAHLIAKHVPPHISILNAGDGRHAHPTQAMLDMFTIRHHKSDFVNLKVAIVGDLKHSRVARSQISALRILGCKDIRVIAPKTLLPNGVEDLGVTTYTNMDQGISGVDAILMLRLQNERMTNAHIPNASEYFKYYGLNYRRLSLADPEAIVLHPGPLNRGVEISSKIADSKRSVILQQVEFGVIIRMAVLAILASNQHEES